MFARHLPSGIVLISALFWQSGCASSGDLDKLRQEMNASVAGVRGDLGKTAQSAVEVMAAKQAEQQKQTDQALKAIQEALAANDAKLAEISGKMIEVGSRYEALAKATEQVQVRLQIARDTITELLKTQESSHKAGLNAVTVLMQQLGSGEAKLIRTESSSTPPIVPVR